MRKGENTRLKSKSAVLNIEKKQEGNALTVKLAGHLDTNTAPVFEREIAPVLSEIDRLTLDLEKLDYISSAGLRVLLLFAQEMEAQKKTMEEPGLKLISRFSEKPPTSSSRTSLLAMLQNRSPAKNTIP